MDPWYPRVLIIGPGGVQGFQALGCLIPISELQLLKYTDTYCGVSVGSILCLLLSVGYTIKEIITEALVINLFKDGEGFDFRNIFSNNGLLSNEPFRQQLNNLVFRKLGKIPTLRELYIMTGNSFIATTLNVDDEKWEMMGPQTHGNLSAVDAAMFSMNIPFFFYQLVYFGKSYVDGSLGNPYPVDYFDHDNTNILGLYMKDEVSVSRIVEPITSGLTIQKYVQKIIRSILDHRRNDLVLHSSDKCKHICLESNIGGFEVSQEDKIKLIVLGYNKGVEFVEKFQSDDVEAKPQYSYPPYYKIEE